MSISAAITARDAELLLPDLFASLDGQVDEIIVGLDDRTVDKTREVALALGAKVFDVSLVRDGVTDFAQGRNQTLAHVWTDWFLWIDTDDVLVSTVNLHDLVKEVPSGTKQIWLPYLYVRDEQGNVSHEHYRERLIRMDANPVWKSRLHETCHIDGPMGVYSEGGLDRSKARVLVDHKNRAKTIEGKYERNHPILLKMIEEDPNDLRAVREMAEHQFASSHWDEAVMWFDRFIDGTTPALSPGTPLDERWMAVIYKAKAERMAGRIRDAMRTADRALLMCPQYADSYFELEYGYLAEGHWAKVIWWFEEGKKKAVPSGILHTSPHDYDLAPYRAAHQAFYERGELEQAIECVKHALQFLPEDIDLLHAAAGYTHLYNRRIVVETAAQNIQYLLDNNEVVKAEAAMTVLPAGAFEDYPTILDPVQRNLASRSAHMGDDRTYRTFYMNEKNEVDAPALLAAGQGYPRLDWTLERLLRNGAKRVLNVGIGSGFDSLLYAKNGIKTVGIDVDPIRVQDCNFAAVRAGLLTLMDAPDHSPQLHPFHEHAEACWYGGEAISLNCGAEVHAHGVWTADCEMCGPVLQVPDISTDSIVQFHTADGANVPDRVRSLGPFDAVVLAELLEHVRDVDAVIEQAEGLAPLVIVSTPDGTAPQIPYPTHVRSWSPQELENLFWKRGRLTESHLIPGEMDQIAIEYRPGETLDGRMPVVIFCGPGLEQWNPDQIDRDGLGGSETAVVYLARELVQRGFRVMIYAEAEGVWDGVFYRHHSKFVPENPVGIFIAWRNPTLVDLPIAAEKKFLWVHDIDCGDNLTEERASKFDGVLAVSQFHADHLKAKYPFIADKLTFIGNGIDPERFVGTEERDPNRFLYVSSPDRGLERALVMWPIIRTSFPDATLSVYYGWENYDRLGRDPGFKRWVQEKADQPGVTWHGRIGQKQLAREMMKSGGLFYPGPHGFEETFCISALEAQAAGCIPVTRDNGALAEVNKYGILLPTAEATVTDYTKALLSTVLMDRDEMAVWALDQTWGAVCERFLDFARLMWKEAVAA